MRQFFTIAIAVGALATSAFALTATSTGLVFTQAGAATPSSSSAAVD
jgi:hypothetical protein